MAKRKLKKGNGDFPTDTHVITVTKDGVPTKTKYPFKSERLAEAKLSEWEQPGVMAGTVTRTGNVLTQVTDRGIYVFTIEEI